VTENRPIFDFDAFYRALSATREARQLTWKQVADQASVHPSTLARMSQSRRPDADGLAALSAWAGLNPGEFMVGLGAAQTAEPLAAISKVIQSDPNLSAESAVALDEIVRTAYRRMVQRDSAPATSGAAEKSGSD
jgi:transcriptional regulator with XRE-family HTH domain